MPSLNWDIGRDKLFHLPKHKKPHKKMITTRYIQTHNTLLKIEDKSRKLIHQNNAYKNHKQTQNHAFYTQTQNKQPKQLQKYLLRQTLHEVDTNDTSPVLNQFVFQHFCSGHLKTQLHRNKYLIFFLFLYLNYHLRPIL